MRHPHRLLVIASLLLSASAFAQQPPPPPPAPMQPPRQAQAGKVPPPPGVANAAADAGANAAANAAADAPLTSGRLQQWLVNPNGDVDGFLLADGTQVAFAPHLSAELLQALKPGDAVQVSGWRTPNLPVLRATRVTASTTGRSVADTPPAPGARAPREPGALAAMNASGRVQRVLYTDRGDANGVLLEGGNIVRFPPHLGATLTPGLRVGSTVYARGWGSRNAQGSALEATAIGATAEGMQELFAGPGRQPGPQAGARGPGGLRGLPPPAAGQAPLPPPVPAS